MKKLGTLVLILFFTGLVFAGKVVPFPDHLKPETITVDKEYIYITEGAAVYIYLLKDFTLKKKFGKPGEGPQEFKLFPGANLRLIVLPDYLLVESVMKLSFFAKDGDFKKEIRTTAVSPMLGRYKPIGEGFVGMGAAMEAAGIFITINLYDSAVKKVKEIFKVKSSIPRPGGDVNPIGMTTLPFLYVYDNKIFVDGENGEIHVFDENGKELKIIKHDYEKVNVTEANINNYINYFKSHPVYKMLYAQDKSKIKFPKHFPIIRKYHIDKKIYVLTYGVKENKREFFIFDIDGKLIKHTFLPVMERNALEMNPYTTKNGKLYHLTEDEKTEKWELHITEIK